MTLTFTFEELVQRWRLARHLEPLRADVSLVFDGADTSALDEAECRQWWLHTVDTAPLEWLLSTDYTPHATLAPDSQGRWVDLTVPQSRPLRRIASLRLEGWEADALIVDPGSPLARMQLNPYTRAGRLQPVAVRLDHCHLRLFPATAGRLVTLTAVDENVYTFDERVLGTMAGREDNPQFTTDKNNRYNE